MIINKNKLQVLLLAFTISVIGMGISLAVDTWDYTETTAAHVLIQPWCNSGGGNGLTSTTFIYGANYAEDNRECLVTDSTNPFYVPVGHDGYSTGTAIGSRTGYTVEFAARIFTITTANFNSFDCGGRDGGGHVGLLLSQNSAYIGIGGLQSFYTDATAYLKVYAGPVASTNDDAFHVWRIAVPAHGTTVSPQMSVWKDGVPVFTSVNGGTDLKRGDTLFRCYKGSYRMWGNAPAQQGSELTYWRIQAGAWDPSHNAVPLVDPWDYCETTSAHTLIQPWCFSGGGNGVTGTTYQYGANYTEDNRECLVTDSTIPFYVTTPHDSFAAGTAISSKTGYTIEFASRVYSITTPTFNSFDCGGRDGGGNIGLLLSQNSAYLGVGAQIAFWTASQATAQFAAPVLSNNTDAFHVWRIAVPAHGTSTPPQVSVWKDGVPVFTSVNGGTLNPTGDTLLRVYKGSYRIYANAPANQGAELSKWCIEAGAWDPSHIAVPQVESWDYCETTSAHVLIQPWCNSGSGNGLTSTTFIYGANYAEDNRECLVTDSTNPFYVTTPHDSFAAGTAIGSQTGYTIRFNARIFTIATANFNSFDCGGRDGGGHVGLLLSQNSAYIGIGGLQSFYTDATAYLKVYAGPIASVNDNAFHYWRIVVPSHSTTQAPQMTVYKDENPTPVFSQVNGGTDLKRSDTLFRCYKGSYRMWGNAPAQQGAELTEWCIQAGAWAPGHLPLVTPVGDWMLYGDNKP